MEIKTVRRMFDFHLKAITMNLEGITHDDSLVQPQTGGNGVNWVLGHIVVSRGSILKLVGESLGWSENESAPYVRGSEQLDPAKALPFSRIVSDLEASQRKLMEGLDRTPVEDWRSSTDSGTKMDDLAFLQFHEAYHIGQLGTLRRIVGRPGAIS